MERRWLVGGLVASVGLNLFLLGVGATVLVRRPHAAAVQPPASMLEAVRQLPPDHQAAFAHVLRREGRQVAPDLKIARKARKDAAQHFSAEPFDSQAVLNDLATARAAEARARAELETAVVGFAQTLPQAERSALAVTIKRGLEADRRSLKGDRRGRDAQREAALRSVPAASDLSPSS
jgi:uncharacterized membrane protein